jgi:osmotically inducible protein OsmC
MALNRSADAIWQGTLKDGAGTISTQSGVLRDTRYSFKTRFEGDPGTNPEELIAAAHAGCFSMALSAQLSGAGITPEKIHTKAVVTLEKLADGFAVTKSALELWAKVPGVDAAKFDELAHAAKAGCPISKLLKAEVTLSYKLEN